MAAGFNRFGIKAGQWTDDTSMALCLADSLLVHYPRFEPVGTFGHSRVLDNNRIRLVKGTHRV